MKIFTVDYRLTAPITLHAAFEIRGFTALLGRSGAGKTSLLKALAGLLPATGWPWAALPPEARPVGYLPQGAALFPHLSVLQNAAFALRGPDRLGKAAGLLAELGIAHLAQRPAAKISGGEAQRVALARALASGPELLLLDEPSAGLDATTQDAVLGHLIETISARQIPALAATHDFNVAGLSDWVVLLSDGLIIQAGPPREVFNHPATTAAARLLGFQNFWSEGGLARTIRAEDVLISPAGRPATITAIRSHGVDLRLACAAPEPFFVIIRQGDPALYRLGQTIHLDFPEKSVKTLVG